MERFAESPKFASEMKLIYAFIVVGTALITLGCKTTEEVSAEETAFAMLDLSLIHI